MVLLRGSLLGAVFLSMGLLAGCADWTEDLQQFVDGDLSSALRTAKDSGGDVEAIYCRRGSAARGVFSVRSFQGRLCDGTHVDGMEILGGAALLMCWEGNREEFRDSGCAERALEAFEIDAAQFDDDIVADRVVSLIDQYLDNQSPVYSGVTSTFCLLPVEQLHPETVGDRFEAFCR